MIGAAAGEAPMDGAVGVLSKDTGAVLYQDVGFDLLYC